MLLSHANGIQMANLQELSTKRREFFWPLAQIFQNACFEHSNFFKVNDLTLFKKKRFLKKIRRFSFFDFQFSFADKSVKDGKKNQKNVNQGTQQKPQFGFLNDRVTSSQRQFKRKSSPTQDQRAKLRSKKRQAS